jgi:transketolase
MSVFERYKKQYPDLAAQMDQMQRRALPTGWDKNLPTFPADAKGVAGREASAKVENVLAKNIPWIVGGAAIAAELALAVRSMRTRVKG